MRKIILILSVVVVTAVFAVVCGAYPADIQKLKDNIKSASLAASASTIYNNGNSAYTSILPDGSWSDINYAEAPASGWDSSQHFNRIKHMTYAYYKSGQLLYKNAALMVKIESALQYAEDNIFHNANGVRAAPGNWWYWSFGVTNTLGDCLIMLQGGMDNNLFNSIMDSYKWYLGNPLNWDLNGMSGKAANSIWAIKANLYYYVIAQDEEAINYIGQKFGENFNIVYAPDEGINEDFSYRAHRMIDTSNYYPSFLSDMNTLIFLYFKDTPYQASREKLDIYSKNIYDGALWAYYKGYFDIGTRGRMYMGPFAKAAFFTNTINSISLIPTVKQQQMQTALPVLLANGQVLFGQKHFWESDFTVHHGNGWYASVRMNSDRNIASEAFGGNGMTSTYLADGATWFLTSGSEYYDNNRFASFNWQKIPGTTVTEGVEPYRYKSYVYGSERFVGGVFTDEFGVSAMQYGDPTILLRAKKSYFFFDDEVVCLGSDINSSYTNTTHTVINQRPQMQSDSPLWVDGVQKPAGMGWSDILSNPKWIQNENVGYYFPQNQLVYANRISQSGAWSDLSVGASKTVYENPFANLSVEHGPNTNNGSYAYAVLPGKTKDEVSEYAQTSPFSILAQTKEIHAVKDNSTNSIGAVFWPREDKIISVALGKRNISDGVLLRSESNTGGRTIPVTAKGLQGRAGFDAAFGSVRFAASESRLQTHNVDVTVKWYDDNSAPPEAYWELVYDSLTGQKVSEKVYYQHSGSWRETTLKLPDARLTAAVLGEAGVEFAVRHSNAPINLTGSDDIYINENSDTFETISTVYGPIINSVIIKPANYISASSEPYSLDIITVDKPCMIFYQIDNGVFTLSLSEPTHDSTTITVDVALPLDNVSLPDGVSALRSGNSTRITFSCVNGRNYTAEFAVPDIFVGDISFALENRPEIEITSLQTGTIKGSSTVRIVNNTAQNVSLIMALYDGNKLLKAVINTEAVSDGDVISAAIQVTADDLEGNPLMKLFTWHGVTGILPVRNDLPAGILPFVL